MDDLLADDVVFYSPIVHTPQRGNSVTTMYLRAAAKTLPGDSAHGAFTTRSRSSAGDVARLEFETTVGSKCVNRVDIIRCDETGRIVEFRVMIQRLQAIDAVHELMRAMLASMQPQLRPDER